MSRSGATPARLLALAALLLAADIPTAAGHPCPTFPTIQRIWSVKDTVWFELKPPYIWNNEPTEFIIIGDPIMPGKAVTIKGRGARQTNGNLRFSIKPPAFTGGIAYTFEAYSKNARCGESERSDPKRFFMPTSLPGEAKIVRFSLRPRDLCTQLGAKLFYASGCADLEAKVKAPPKPTGTWQKLRMTCTPAACKYPCSCGTSYGRAFLAGDDVPACDRVWEITVDSVPGSDGLVNVKIPFVARDLDVNYVCSVFAFNQAGFGPMSFIGGSRTADKSKTAKLPFGPPTKIPTIKSLSVTPANKLTVVIKQVPLAPKNIIVTVKPADGGRPKLIKYGPGKVTARGLEFYFKPSDGLLWNTEYEVTAAYYNGLYASAYYLIGPAEPGETITTPIDPDTLPSISEILMRDRSLCTQLTWDQFYDDGCGVLEVRVNKPALLTTDMPTGLYKLRCVPEGCTSVPPRRRLAYSIPPPCERILEDIGYGNQGSDGRLVFRLPFTAYDFEDDLTCQVALRVGDEFGPFSEPATPFTLPIGPPAGVGNAGAPTIEIVTADAAGKLTVKFMAFKSGPYLLVGRPAQGEAGEEVRIPFDEEPGYVPATDYTPGTPYEFTVAYVNGEYGSAYFFVGPESAPKAFTTPARR